MSNRRPSSAVHNGKGGEENTGRTTTSKVLIPVSVSGTGTGRKFRFRSDLISNLPRNHLPSVKSLWDPSRGWRGFQIRYELVLYNISKLLFLSFQCRCRLMVIYGLWRGYNVNCEPCWTRKNDYATPYKSINFWTVDTLHRTILSKLLASSHFPPPFTQV